MNRTICANLLLVAASCLGLNAQSMQMRAKIPFQFHVGKEVMPAGEYDLSQRNEILLLRKTDGHASGVMSLTLGEILSKPPVGGVLVFNKYGETCFLSTVRSPYSTVARVLPKTRTEAEFARSAKERIETARVPLMSH